MRKYLYLLTGITIGILIAAGSAAAEPPSPNGVRPTLEPPLHLPIDATETPRPTQTPYPILPTLTPTPATPICWCECPCTPPPTPQPVPADFPLRGKGVAGPLHPDDVTGVGATWRYNWNPSIGDWDGIVDVPMIRDASQLDKLRSGEWDIGGDVKIILGFNEPDLCPNQGCLTVEEAVPLWREIEAMYPADEGWLLGSPAPSPNNSTWLLSFWYQYLHTYGEVPRIDFIAVHVYVWHWSHVARMAGLIDTYQSMCESWNKNHDQCTYGLVITEGAAGAFRQTDGSYDYASAITAWDAFRDYEIGPVADAPTSTVKAETTGHAWYTAHDDPYWGFCGWDITTALWGEPCSGDPHVAGEPRTPFGDYFAGLETD